MSEFSEELLRRTIRCIGVHTAFSITSRAGSPIMQEPKVRSPLSVSLCVFRWARWLYASKSIVRLTRGVKYRCSRAQSTCAWARTGSKQKIWKYGACWLRSEQILADVGSSYARPTDRSTDRVIASKFANTLPWCQWQLQCLRSFWEFGSVEIWTFPGTITF